MNTKSKSYNLIQNFIRHFGDSQVSLYTASGRTELGGNHTDHQNGQVLAAAVDLQLMAAVGLAVSEMVLGEDGVCRVHGGGFAGTIQAFVKTEAVDRYKTAMDKLFGDGACQVLRVGGEDNR